MWCRYGEMLYKCKARGEDYEVEYIANPSRVDYERYRAYKKVANSIGYNPVRES